MRKAKNAIAVLLLAVVLVFVVQNMSVVSVRFLAWELSVSRALLLLVVLLIGLVAGLLFGKRR